MADKVKPSRFSYIAHIQKEDGTVLELDGIKESPTANDVYQWLQLRCRMLGGWLVSQHISESVVEDNLLPWKDDEPNVPALPAPVRVEVPTVFADTAVFGEFTETYEGAIPIKFKPKE
jgi:hypothetical protein